MENYIGKSCPYCGMEITAEDAVTVCPVCGTAHHQSCWNTNGGCINPSCSGQAAPVQEAPVAPAQEAYAPAQDAYAPAQEAYASAPPVQNAYTQAPAVNPMGSVCTNCGTTVAAGQAFCPSCGQKAGVTQNYGVNPAFNPYNPQFVPEKKKPTKAIIIGIVAVVAVIIAIILLFGTKNSPLRKPTTEELCAEGKYVEAYEKATDDDVKFDVLAENVIAVLSQESSEGLKDPSSFSLRDAWYYAFMHEDGDIGGYAVLYISGANSYGAKVSSYWAYTLGENQEWNYIGSVSVTYDEDDDDWSDMLTKIIVNAGMEKGEKLTKEQVKRINTQFEEDTLYKVEAIDWDDVDTSDFRKG